MQRSSLVLYKILTLTCYMYIYLNFKYCIERPIRSELPQYTLCPVAFLAALSQLPTEESHLLQDNL